jgi:hypothetical protein
MSNKKNCECRREAEKFAEISSSKRIHGSSLLSKLRHEAMKSDKFNRLVSASPLLWGVSHRLFPMVGVESDV